MLIMEDKSVETASPVKIAPVETVHTIANQQLDHMQCLTDNFSQCHWGNWDA